MELLISVYLLRCSWGLRRSWARAELSITKDWLCSERSFFWGRRTGRTA